MNKKIIIALITAGLSSNSFGSSNSFMRGLASLRQSALTVARIVANGTTNHDQRATPAQQPENLTQQPTNAIDHQITVPYIPAATPSTFFGRNEITPQVPYVRPWPTETMAPLTNAQLEQLLAPLQPPTGNTPPQPLLSDTELQSLLQIPTPAPAPTDNTPVLNNAPQTVPTIVPEPVIVPTETLPLIEPSPILETTSSDIPLTPTDPNPFLADFVFPTITVTEDSEEYDADLTEETNQELATQPEPLPAFVLEPIQEENNFDPELRQLFATHESEAPAPFLPATDSTVTMMQEGHQTTITPEPHIDFLPDPVNAPSVEIPNSTEQEQDQLNAPTEQPQELSNNSSSARRTYAAVAATSIGGAAVALAARRPQAAARATAQVVRRTATQTVAPTVRTAAPRNTAPRTTGRSIPTSHAPQRPTLAPRQIHTQPSTLNVRPVTAQRDNNTPSQQPIPTFTTPPASTPIPLGDPFEIIPYRPDSPTSGFVPVPEPEPLALASGNLASGTSSVYSPLPATSSTTPGAHSGTLSAITTPPLHAENNFTVANPFPVAPISTGTLSDNATPTPIQTAPIEPIAHPAPTVQNTSSGTPRPVPAPRQRLHTTATPPAHTPTPAPRPPLVPRIPRHPRYRPIPAVRPFRPVTSAPTGRFATPPYVPPVTPPVAPPAVPPTAVVAPTEEELDDTIPTKDIEISKSAPFVSNAKTPTKKILRSPEKKDSAEPLTTEETPTQITPSVMAEKPITQKFDPYEVALRKKGTYKPVIVKATQDAPYKTTEPTVTEKPTAPTPLKTVRSGFNKQTGLIKSASETSTVLTPAKTVSPLKTVATPEKTTPSKAAVQTAQGTKPSHTIPAPAIAVKKATMKPKESSLKEKVNGFISATADAIRSFFSAL